MRVDVIFLDFKKAFDSVPHQRLLKKLKGYGITTECFNSIKSFLSSQYQRVIVNDDKSQGSVLGQVY